MHPELLPHRTSSKRPCGRFEIAVALISLFVALLGARPYAGSWNDGSRLAAVESIVDRGTMAIDGSFFVIPDPNPYEPSDRAIQRTGTLDKLYIEGRYYSDKPMLQSMAMAGAYWILQQTAGLQARHDPMSFCYWMTVLSSGLAYSIAGWAIARMTWALELSAEDRVLLVASFLVTTAALPYTRYVNQHIVLLAVASLVVLEMAEVAERANRGGSLPKLCGIGLLVGTGYGLDLGAGPVLALSIVAWALWRWRTARAAAVLAAAMTPPILAYHAINYSIGGTFRPANANPALFAWPGSPFDATNLSGGWRHDGVIALFGYSLELLFGTRGFLLHNPTLLLGLAGFLIAGKASKKHRSELGALAAWGVLTWLAYSLGSGNRSGAAYSIRWFVPLLAAGYYGIAMALRASPVFRADLAILSATGAPLAAIGWWNGPWMQRMVSGYWLIVAAGLTAWGLLAYRRWTSIPPKIDVGDVRLAA